MQINEAKDEMVSSVSLIFRLGNGNVSRQQCKLGNWPPRKAPSTTRSALFQESGSFLRQVRLQTDPRACF